MRLLYTAVMLAVWVIAAVAASQTTSAEDLEPILEQVQKRYENVAALKCSFEQENRYLGGESLVQRGSLELERPAKMLWDYTEPKARQFISDGERLWIYTPADGQAFLMQDVDSAGQAQLFGFVIGLKDVREHFAVRVVSGAQADPIELELVPNEAMAGVASLIVFVGRADHAITGLTIDDGMGNLTITRLSDVTTPADIPDERFTFVAPEGVEVMPYP
jgi:outer membrane lipoprotein carrier protein